MAWCMCDYTPGLRCPMQVYIIIHIHVYCKLLILITINNNTHEYNLKHSL